MCEEQRRGVLKTLTGTLAGDVAFGGGPSFLNQNMVGWLMKPVMIGPGKIHAAIVVNLKSKCYPPIECLPPNNKMSILRSGTVCLNAMVEPTDPARLQLYDFPLLRILVKGAKDTTWNKDFVSISSFAVSPHTFVPRCSDSLYLISIKQTHHLSVLFHVHCLR
jgi:hypothetical protein